MADNKIFIGTIEGVFGYGMAVFGHSEQECMDALRKSYHSWKGAVGGKKSFDDAFEYWGGCIQEVERGVVYFDNFKS